MIKKLIRTLVVAGLMALAGCAGTGGARTQEQQVALACASATAAVRTVTLAIQFGKLSDEQIGKAATAIAIYEPICTAPTPPTLDSLKLAAFVQAIALLQAQAAELQEPTP
jgi:hypothetical protein